MSGGPQKFQFSAEFELLKDFRGPEEEEERIKIYANSLQTPVYAEGLSNADFSSTVEKMLAVLFTFDSSGSGWMVERVIRINVNFSKYRPATGSSFIALPTKLQTCRALLNIRNHLDNDCFIYCYVAALFFKNNGCYSEEERNDRFKLTSPDFYKNMSELQPAGEFPMPMGFHKMTKFETLNDVQVNVFGLENRDLFTVTGLIYCFIYCYVAALFFKNNGCYSEEEKNDRFKLTSPDFYKNMSELQPAGEFPMPMSFHKMTKFETLNDVQVYVFGLENRDLFPMRVSKRTTSELSLDLLLYENDKHPLFSYQRFLQAVLLHQKHQIQIRSPLMQKLFLSVS